MKTTIIKNSKIDKMNIFYKKIYLFFRYFFHKYIKNITNPKYYPYYYDGVATRHNCSFVQNKDFLKAYNRGKKSYNFDYEMPFRAHQSIWSSNNAFELDGDFIEFGTGKGFTMTCVLESLKEWNNSKKKLWLFDTFKPATPDQDGKQDGKETCKFYANNIEEIKNNFSEWKNINFIEGKLPETLKDVLDKNKITKISFVHVDLNFPKVEYECLEYVWPLITKGGIILFDDYAYNGFEKSYELMNNFAKKVNKLILTTPSGQGILIK